MKRFTLSLILAVSLVALASSASATAPPMWDGQTGPPHDPYTMEPWPVVEKGFTATRSGVLADRGGSGSAVRSWRIAYWPKVAAIIQYLRMAAR